MRKSAVLLSVILLCQSCSLFKAKVVPYPAGVVFPVEMDHELTYEGEIIPPVQKQEQFIYFSTRKGKVYCVDGSKREIAWHLDMPLGLSSPPCIAEDRLYVNDDQSTLYSIGLEGDLLYKITFMSEITSGIGVHQGKIYIGTEKGLFYCLDAQTGQVHWEFQADDVVRSNPVFWQDYVLFGCDDLNVYFIDESGRLSGKISVGGKTGKTLFVDENRLYFGTDDRFLQCVNLKRKKIDWKIRSGGAAHVAPVVSEKRIFFLCWNCVLYCLQKRNGTILWWNSVPSRSFYGVKVVHEKVVVSSFSPELVSFDIGTGESRGRFDASQEIKSNPEWHSPYLIVHLHDPEEDEGRLLFLIKQVKVTLSSSRKSPRKQNEEITFRAQDTGFYLPKYEFYLTPFVKAMIFPGVVGMFPKEEKKVVQASSDLPTWDWFPEEQGYYSVDVIVTDEKEKAHANIPFVIQERIVDVSLSAAPESPQKVGQNIVFTADSSGAIQPTYEFRLGSLKWLKSPSGLLFLSMERDEVVQEASELDSWTWTPEDEGFYLIRVFVQDEQESANSQMIFMIDKE
jgi:outer membrane protein assembly factor BamB